MRHLLSIDTLETSQIQQILEIAKLFQKHFENEPQQSKIPILAGKRIVLLIMENSTRTRTSFEVAVQRLGGDTVHFTPENSSVTKGETLMDTARVILAMKPDGLVVRHHNEGSGRLLVEKLNLENTALINAGDGKHEHPTQALLDTYTIQSKLGSIAGKRILIVGDILHSRVARSNIAMFQRLGASVCLCGPPSCLPKPEHLDGVDITYHLDTAIAEADVVMTLRIQKERQSPNLFPSLGEYRKFWGLNTERTSRMKKNSIIMHPGPMNRGVEITDEVISQENTVIFNQVENGVFIRMAILSLLLSREELERWMKMTQRGDRS